LFSCSFCSACPVGISEHVPRETRALCVPPSGSFFLALAHPTHAATLSYRHSQLRCARSLLEPLLTHRPSCLFDRDASLQTNRTDGDAVPVSWWKWNAWLTSRPVRHVAGAATDVAARLSLARQGNRNDPKAPSLLERRRRLWTNGQRRCRASRLLCQGTGEQAATCWLTGNQPFVVVLVRARQSRNLLLDGRNDWAGR